MTDIVERLLLKKTLETVEDVHVLFADAAAEIERLREALRYYANKTQEEWVNVTGADDGVVARAALGGEE